MENQKDSSKEKKAWVIAADMGYGHQRTAYTLRDMSFGGKVINANSYTGIPKKDKKFWQETRSLYEFVSRFKSRNNSIKCKELLGCDLSKPEGIKTFKDKKLILKNF